MGIVRRFLLRHPLVSAVLASVLVLATIWGVQLWSLQRSVTDNAQYWSSPQGEDSGLLYVALGDSTAQGVGASDPDAGYVAVIAERLRASTGKPVQVINLSRSHARVADVTAQQLPDLAGLDPDLVTVGVGGNDIADYDPDRFRSDITALVDGLPQGTVIADIPYFMHGQADTDANEAAATLTDVAQSRQLVVAPLQETFRGRGWGGMLTDYAADFFHPNDRGHRLWADAFWQQIEPLTPAMTGEG